MCPRRYRHRWAVPRAGGRVPGPLEGGNVLRGCFAMFYVTQTTSLTDFEVRSCAHLHPHPGPRRSWRLPPRRRCLLQVAHCAMASWAIIAVAQVNGQSAPVARSSATRHNTRSAALAAGLSAAVRQSAACSSAAGRADCADGVGGGACDCEVSRVGECGCRVMGESNSNEWEVVLGILHDTSLPD